MSALTYTDALKAQAKDIADACLQCGKCFTACPMTTPGGIDNANPVAVVGGIVDILRGGAGTDAARRWTEICTHSGKCIPACDYGVNPRLMMSLAGLAVMAASDAGTRRANGVKKFTTMSNSVRMLSRLLTTPEQLARVNPRPDKREMPAVAPEVVFYTGCNVLRTPHIALLCLDVLDALGTRYEVMGGPSHCCGVMQFGAGDAAGSGRFSYSTIDKLASAGIPKVLSWCPSCQIQFGEIAIPAYERSHGQSPIAMAPFAQYLAERLDDLRPLLRHPVHKRVALNERPTFPGVTAAVKAVLAAIPGLEFVELDVPRAGAMSNRLTFMPEFKEKLRTQEFQAAAAAGVTTLATVYHACQRETCQFENDVSFEIVNFMSLIGESMGIFEADLYKRLAVTRDVDAMVAQTAGNSQAHGLEQTAVRQALFNEYGR